MRIASVELISGFVVRLRFTDGVTKVVDLAPFMRGPMFEPLRLDPAQFRTVRVDLELGTIVWPGGADLDPDVLYGRQTPSWSESTPNEMRG